MSKGRYDLFQGLERSWDDGLVNDGQVHVIRTPVIGIADWWKSLVFP